MGLDDQPSPPNPRPSDSAKTPSVPRGGVFLLCAKPEPCRWKWSVRKESYPVLTVER
jgi:hypothetical protein